MSFVATMGDAVTTNHACDVATTCLDGNPKVTVMGQPVHYVGGKAVAHTFQVGDKCPVHTPVLAPNTTKVMVYPFGPLIPVQIARLGDNYSPICTGVITATKNVKVFAY
jgi:hypothetical protein